MDDAPPPHPDPPAGGPTPEAPGPARGHAGGFTLDLSRNTPGKRKRKGPAPLVTRTIDLSTKKAAPAPPQPPPKAEPPPKAPRREKGGGPPRGGATLADLLDPETLARLRGG